MHFVIYYALQFAILQFANNSIICSMAVRDPQQSCRAHPFPLSELLRRTLTKVLKRALSAQEASCCCFNCVTVIVGVVGAFDCWHSHVTHSGVMPHYHCCAAALPGFFSVCPIRAQWQLRNGRLHEMAKWNAPNVIRAGHIPIAIAVEKMPIANCSVGSAIFADGLPAAAGEAMCAGCSAFDCKQLHCSANCNEAKLLSCSVAEGDRRPYSASRKQVLGKMKYTAIAVGICILLCITLTFTPCGWLIWVSNTSFDFQISKSMSKISTFEYCPQPRLELLPMLNFIIFGTSPKKIFATSDLCWVKYLNEWASI